MNISSRTEYGLRALIEIARNRKGSPVSRSLIAKRQKIPLAFLTQVLQALVNGKIIISTRGPRGGYLLAKPANQTTLLEVVNILQGPITPRHCVDSKLAENCSLVANCNLIGVWAKLRDAGEEVLKNVSLSDISKLDNSCGGETKQVIKKAR
jgi:Rrf2 family protein